MEFFSYWSSRKRPNLDLGESGRFRGTPKTKQIQVTVAAFVVGFNEEMIPKILCVVILIIFFFKIMFSLILPWYKLNESISKPPPFKGLYFTHGFYIHYLIWSKDTIICFIVKETAWVGWKPGHLHQICVLVDVFSRLVKSLQGGRRSPGVKVSLQGMSAFLPVSRLH